MGSVEKCVNESMGWMNSKMNAQSKLGLMQDPVVKVAEIIAKIQVSERVFKMWFFIPISVTRYADVLLQKTHYIFHSPGTGGCM